MLLALGPLQLDTAVRTVVVGLVDGSDTSSVEHATVGADAMWLRRSATPNRVAAVRRTGLPVGVTADDVTELRDLVEAGAVAVECGAHGAVELAAAADLVLWCTAQQAEDARACGVAGSKLVVEGSTGATVEGQGPAAWGAVTRAVLAGAGVVRTGDLGAVRRVATVADRLLAARQRSAQGASA